MPNKVPIPRLRRDSAGLGPRRTPRACDACRQRKTKCNGGKPVCSQCQSAEPSSCVYSEGRIKMERKALVSARKTIELYEDLLRGISARAGDEDKKRIKRALEGPSPVTRRHATRRSSTSSSTSTSTSSSSSSSSSAGSLDAIDTVDENLDRHEKSRATGYMGKNSEIAWMQRLEAESRRCSDDNESAAKIPHHQLPDEDSFSAVSYHLDDLKLDDSTVSDVFVLPDKSLADQLLQVYLDKVHPSLPVIRPDLFLEQYKQVFSYTRINPGERWLSVLNLILAIGCRLNNLFCSDNAGHADETMFFNRARHLSTSDDLIYNHDDLQQVQFLTLVAFYFLTRSQISRSWKMIGIAARAGIALGLNFRKTHGKFDTASKEARSRLWWSIFYLEHILSAMTGRISCLGDGSSSVSLPLPFDVSAMKHEAKELSHERQSSTYDLGWTERPDQIADRPAWVKNMPLSESLYFFYLVDLALITHQITNQVYSADVVNRGWAHIGDRIQVYNKKLVQWLADLPPTLVFNSGQVDMSSSQISLALHYYSACIVINRPCLTRPEAHETTGIRFPRSRFGNDIALQCLRAALALVEVIPDQLDKNWANSIAPSWTLLHFMMQATVILLLHLSIGSVPVNTRKGETPETSGCASDTPKSPSVVLAATKKALRWLNVLGQHEESSKRGFEFCRHCFCRIVEKQDLDTSGLSYPPDSEQNEWHYLRQPVKDSAGGNIIPSAQQQHRGGKTYPNGRQSNFQGHSSGQVERDTGDLLFEDLQETHIAQNWEPRSLTLLDPDLYMADHISQPEEPAIEDILLSMMGSNA